MRIVMQRNRLAIMKNCFALHGDGVVTVVEPLVTVRTENDDIEQRFIAMGFLPRDVRPLYVFSKLPLFVHKLERESTYLTSKILDGFDPCLLLFVFNSPIYSTVDLLMGC